jgi:hypothetical protein
VRRRQTSDLTIRCRISRRFVTSFDDGADAHRPKRHSAFTASVMKIKHFTLRNCDVYNSVMASYIIKSCVLSGHRCTKRALIIGAVMRKLLHIIYGVLKSGKPFDPSWSANHGLTVKTVS